ncbi:MAG: hypothetical protein IJ093_01210 [Bacilli bacterium]|nr:hypothetical protein [Bacilli bacterium]
MDKIATTYLDIKKINEEFFATKNQELEEKLSLYNTVREKAVAAALFLTTNFPKLPYFWGGGHLENYEEILGINKKLGSIQTIIAGNDPYYIKDKKFIYGYDCSGFVSWCLINSGYKKINKCLIVKEMLSLGDLINITDKNVLKKAKLGDLAWQEGHIGIIVDINKEKNEISVAHSADSYGGMTITTQSVTTGLITKEDFGSEVDINRNNQKISSKISDKYFTKIILMEY